MTPFYFGSGDRQLFGIYDPALSGSDWTHAIIFCHPWGSEYLHAHRTLRQLSTKLARAGFHVLRFDYFGTGDSSGEITEATLSGWEADIGLAIDEIKDMTRATKVALVGLRLGAALAAQVAARRLENLDALVLWDPVLSGGEYVSELLSPSPPSVQTAPRQSDGSDDEVQGFLLTAKMRREILAIDLLSFLPEIPVQTLIVTTAPRPSHDALSAVRSEVARSSPLVETLVDSSPWIEDPTRIGALPVAVMQRIVQWLESWKKSPNTP
jgi:pimeloyl-ACP methyl ester carboxylesterase